MSARMAWRPFGERSGVGDAALRDALRAEFGAFPFVLTEQALAFLRGLHAGHVNGADTLIEAIKEYGEIELSVGD